MVRKLRSTRTSPYRTHAKSHVEDETGQAKKRKLARIDDIPKLSLDDGEIPPPFERIDASSFKGVVWKKSDNSVKKAGLYEPGIGEKVALLRNWREIFKESQPKWNGSGIRKPNVDQPPSRGKATSKIRGKTLKAPSRSADTPAEDHSFSEDVAGVENPQLSSEPITGTSFTPPPLSINGAEKPAVVVKTKDDPRQRPRSRLRQTTTVQDKSPETGNVLSVSKQVTSAKEPQLKSRTIKEDKQLSIAVEVPAPSAAAGRSQRKRKASDSVEEAAVDKAKNAQPQPKRAVQTKRTKTDDQTKKTSSSTATVRRSTRTRNRPQ